MSFVAEERTRSSNRRRRRATDLVPGGDAPARLSPSAGEGWPLRSHLGVITLSWVFGAVWQTAASGSPVTQFMKGLGASNFQFGLFAALPFVASLLSVPSSLFIERTGKRKPLFFASLYLQRLLWIPMALVPMWIVTRGGGASSHPAAITLFLLLALLMHATGALGNPAWVSWMADVVPERLRSRYFARRRQLSIPLAMIAALASGWVLDHQAAASPDPAAVLRWCALIFMVAAVFGAADIALFHPVPDPYRAPKAGGGLLRAMRTPLKDRQFLAFGGFVGVLTFAVSFMGQFTTLYLFERVYVGERASSFGIGAQLMLLVMPMVAQLFVLPVWGRAADRIGKKPILTIAAVGMVPIGIAWTLIGPSNVWLGYLLSFCGAVLWTGVEVANFNLVIEMSGRSDGRGGSAYVAANTVIVNIAGCMGGLAAGLIAQLLRDFHWTPAWGFKTFTFYDVLFALSGVMRLTAVAVFLPFIHEPTARPTTEALRFISANIYSNVFNAVLQPLRVFGLARESDVPSSDSDEAVDLRRRAA